jgi:hypothetical protein
MGGAQFTAILQPAHGRLAALRCPPFRVRSRGSLPGNVAEVLRTRLSAESAIRCGRNGTCAGFRRLRRAAWSMASMSRFRAP